MSLPTNPIIFICASFLECAANRYGLKSWHTHSRDESLDVVAGTDDVVYGQAGAMNLASTDPNLTITNADSHEYFAENTPAQP